MDGNQAGLGGANILSLIVALAPVAMSLEKK